jgi:hypothetical protein
VPNQIPPGFFSRNWKKCSKIYMEKNFKSVLAVLRKYKKKNKLEV